MGGGGALNCVYGRRRADGSVDGWADGWRLMSVKRPRVESCASNKLFNQVALVWRPTMEAAAAGIGRNRRPAANYGRMAASFLCAQLPISGRHSSGRAAPFHSGSLNGHSFVDILYTSVEIIN